ncbi:endonuclease [Tenacibaculum sp. S7007]|uniref:Endonuclease n=1 Tax=Tenacibaculum pelagium TaxID=2759527 RepID=A0A839AKC0_9FLAO|nr:endonuclease [Tenacibaculum pelagium]MBA6154937.1 endonuclease [Tenacibaculum pelagium]
MKKLLPFVLLITSLSVFSQIPSYYNDVNLNQTSTALKDALATKIISTHATNLSYTPGVWDALKQSDLDPTDNSKVILIYGYSDSDGNYVTDRTRSKDASGGTAGTQWNREHVYPKSLGNPNLGTSGPGADVHHLRPADISFNGQRSSKKFAAGSGNAGDSNGGWYPGDEWKGDVARMMMYVYLRYGNQCLPSNVTIGTANSSDSNMIDLLLQWNAEDPVSDFEKQRNPILQGIQGNRNPFIDNPAFATQIWGGPQAEDLFGNGGGGNNDTQAPTAPTNLVASSITENSVNLNWSASTDNTGVTGYDVYNGANKITTINATSYSVTGLTASTAYTFSVKAKDAANNISTSSNTVNVTTTAAPTSGTATDLLISEYVEGSSNNKALEIANFTGGTINLSGYSLKKASNGGGWSNTLTLSGSLENGKTYVVANSSASTTIKNKAQKTETSVTSFNGNDAIGLFKGSTLIDLIGNPNSSSTFAQDKTLQRKSSVKSPNSSYTTSEWNVLSKDTFSGLGSHVIDGSTPDTQAPTAPTNLAGSNVTQTSVDLAWTAATDNVAVTGYDLFNGNTKIATVTSTSYSVTGLTAATNYTFSVKAKDAAGNISSASNTLGITTKSNADTTAPSAPTNLAVSNVTQTSANLAWTAATDNVAVTGYDVFNGSTKIATVTSTSYSVTGLTASTNYTFSVKAKDAANNISTSSNTVGVTTKSVVVTYCSSKGNNSSYEYIDNVVIGGISNSTSANGGYGDFTTQTGNLSYGNNTIIVSAGFSGSSYTENWRVWIDFNKNGTFDSNEEVVSGSSSSSGNLSYTFSVPSSALSGKTRMRVSMKWNGAPTACETFSYGEVEDYSVNIGASSRSNNSSSVVINGKLGNEAPVFSANIFPNPTANFIKIQMADDREAYFNITNTIGQKIASGKVDHANINVSNLTNGIYILEVTDGQRSFTKKFIKK